MIRWWLQILNTTTAYSKITPVRVGCRNLEVLSFSLLKTGNIVKTSTRLLENLSIVIDEEGDGNISFKEFIGLIDNLESAEKEDIQGEQEFSIL